MSFNSADTPSSLYLLVDEHAGGILVPWIKYSRSTGDYSILEEYLDTARNSQLGALRRKKGRGKSGPNILDDINQDRLGADDFLKALKILDGFSACGQKVFKYRELVWDIEQRGRMGENLLHICLLHNTADMNDLAKQIVNRFPKIVNDIFISEDYYAKGFGTIFLTNTIQNCKYYNEIGLTLLAAAAHFYQDCFRLLRAFRADPNKTDTNGNTVLHLTVIHDLPEMFTLAYNSGASLSIRNNLKLTPLALAARLANKRMFSLLLECEMDIVWRYGNIVCKAYPLVEIDSIREEDGDLNPCSVLANVVYGDKSSHLDFFDGLLEELLERKWEAFAKRRLFQSLFGYLWFLLVFYIAFATRNVTESYEEEGDSLPLNMTDFNDVIITVQHLSHFESGRNEPLQKHCHLWNYNGGKKQMLRFCCEILTLLAVLVRTTKDIVDMQQIGMKRWWLAMSAFPEKVLHKVSQLTLLLIVPIRTACFLHPVMLLLENVMTITVVLMTTMHFLFYCRGMKFVGPFVLMVYKIIVRDMLRFLLIYSVFVLGFAQAFYVIFHSCEMAEKNYQEEHGLHPDDDYRGKFENIMNSPREALMRMIIMSVGEFGAFYKNLNDCKSRVALQGKVFFSIYELLVTLMLLNLLIAMMTRTYEKIAETEKEWKRQVNSYLTHVPVGAGDSHVGTIVDKCRAYNGYIQLLTTTSQ
nr:Ankyrin and Ion transport domain containing protein [Haemonchus contortus]